MAWRLGAVVVAGMMLGGCGVVELRDRMEACGVSAGPFPDAVKCMEERWPPTSGLNEYGLLYYRYAEALAEEVNAGRLTNTQAKLAHAEILVAITQRSTADRRAAIASILNAYQVTNPIPISGRAVAPTTCVQVNNTLTCR